MLCGMAKCYQHSAPPTLERMRRNPNKINPHFSSPLPPKKTPYICNKSNEPPNGDWMRGPWKDFVCPGPGMLQDEFPGKIHNSFNDKVNGREKQNWATGIVITCLFANGAMLL